MLEFNTFAEADAYLRQEGYSALSIDTEDHYAVYFRHGKKAEIGPGSISGHNGNWCVTFIDDHTPTID